MNRPLILDNIIQMTSQKDQILKYDHYKSMCVIDLPEGNIPFIFADSMMVAVETNTRVAREGNDETSHQLDFMTKTEQSREHEDESLDYLTKTSIQRETNDDDTSYY